MSQCRCTEQHTPTGFVCDTCGGMEFRNAAPTVVERGKLDWAISAAERIHQLYRDSNYFRSMPKEPLIQGWAEIMREEFAKEAVEPSAEPLRQPVEQLLERLAAAFTRRPSAVWFAVAKAEIELWLAARDE